jgi:hypothetical protein
MPPKEWEHPVWVVSVLEIVRTEYYIRAASEDEAEKIALETKPELLQHGDRQIISSRITSTIRNCDSQ